MASLQRQRLLKVVDPIKYLFAVLESDYTGKVYHDFISHQRNINRDAVG